MGEVLRFLRDKALSTLTSMELHAQMSMLAENSSFCWAKIPPPCGGDGLQFQPAGAKMKSAGEAEAGSAGVQPAKE